MPHLVQTMAALKHRLTELLQHLQCEKWSLHRHKADTLWVMWSYNLATVQGDPGSCFKVMQILCPQKLHSFTGLEIRKQCSYCTLNPGSCVWSIWDIWRWLWSPATSKTPLLCTWRAQEQSGIWSVEKNGVKSCVTVAWKYLLRNIWPFFCSLSRSSKYSQYRLNLRQFCLTGFISGFC